MKIILTKKKLTKLLQIETNIGFVPTMGAIHKGHISLINKSISQCDKTVVSIFVNKPQFNKRNLILWIFPFLLLMISFVIFVYKLKKR